MAANDSASVRNYTSTQTSVTIAVLANDSDPDAACSGLNVNSVTIVATAQTRFRNRQRGRLVTFRPQRFYRGTDTFNYRVADANGALSNIASVRVNVTR